MAYAHRAKNTYAALPFISTWKTDNLSTGSSTNTQVKLPLVSTGTYKFTVNWGDGSSNVITSWNQAQVTHTYAAIGTYTITITGFIKGWSFGPETPTPPTGSDRLKLLTITQFGCLRFTDYAFMFHGCENLTLTTVNDIANLKGVTNCHGFFRRCLALTTVNNLNKLDVSKIQVFQRFFGLCDNFNQNIGNWNVGKGTNFAAMFFGFNSSTGGKFNNGGDPSIGNWDMSSAIDLTSMFVYQGKFNQNVGAWNTSNVTSMSSLFYGNLAAPYAIFNNGGSDSIKNWDTSKVTTINGMFYAQPNFNQEVGLWNVSNVTNFANMFNSYFGSSGPFISNFNNGGSASIGNWNTSKATNMNGMFSGATKFNQNIGNWDVSKVTNMSYMLQARDFNNGGSPDINNWDVSKVTTMSRMLQVAFNFNQPLDNWKIPLVTDMINFMYEGEPNPYAFSVTNYSNFLIALAAQPVKPNVSLRVNQYYNSSCLAARAILAAAPNNWTFVDRGLQP